MMDDSFGTRLRRERERRNITLAHIANATKIQASLFAGLERDDVSRWPNGIFRRAFVRAYAQAIGLDPEETCREFVERFPEPGDLAAQSADGSTPGAHGLRRPMPVAASPFATGRRSATWSSTDEGRDTPASLRIVLADERTVPRRHGGSDDNLPACGPWSRWRAVALDLGTVLIVALTAFIALDTFWMPLAVASVVYYLGSTLLLGATPGVRFFAGTAASGDSTGLTSPPVTSLDRALEMRDMLMAEARPRSMSPPLHQPVDIDSRRVRA